MGELIEGDDGLPAEEVGPQAKEKIGLLCRYIDISRSARAKFLGRGKAGATYIDLFCGAGRCRIEKTGEWIDGSAVAAWKTSVDGHAPFSGVYVNDVNVERLRGTVIRLQNLGCPVHVFRGEAVASIKEIVSALPRHSLNFAFLDPYSLKALDFEIIRSLSVLRRMDILVHLSKMDLQRNLGSNLGEQNSTFDVFAPGWRDRVNVTQAHQGIRSEVIDYWRDLVTTLALDHSPEMKLIRGAGNQPLYWLLLVARHELALKFWKTAANPEKQGKLFD
jgi:three-Cys-motif partner protein